MSRPPWIVRPWHSCPPSCPLQDLAFPAPSPLPLSTQATPFILSLMLGTQRDKSGSVSGYLPATHQWPHTESLSGSRGSPEGRVQPDSGQSGRASWWRRQWGHGLCCGVLHAGLCSFSWWRQAVVWTRAASTISNSSPSADPWALTLNPGAAVPRLQPLRQSQFPGGS